MHLAETMRLLELDENQVIITTSSMAHILSFAMVFLAGLMVPRCGGTLIPQIDAPLGVASARCRRRRHR